MNPPTDPLVRSAIEGRVPAGPCPDVEVLGLFAERALTGAELRAVETHVGSCARCQAIVGDVVISGPAQAPSGTSGGADVLGWLTGWRWLMPAASLAAVVMLAVWVTQTTPDEAAPVAETSAPAATLSTPGAPASTPAATASAPVATAPPRDAQGGLARGDALASTRALAEAPAGREAFRATEDTGGAGTTAKAANALRDTAAESNAAPAGPPIDARAENRVADLAPAAPSARPGGDPADAARRRDTSAGASGAETRERAAPVPAGVRADTATPSAAAVAAAISAAPEARAEKAAAAPSPAPAPMPAPGAPAAGRALAVPAPREPGAAYWRVAAGRLEQSADAGRTWRSATFPEGLRVVAVADLSARLAWAITANAVVRTVDGETWARVGTPPDAPFAAIVATTRDHATVTSASGARHATADGGATWRRVP